MKIPKIKGIIDRRILINYQIEKEVLENYLPKPFKPRIVKGRGVAGICLIRLKEIRPKGLPKQIGISSENGAHRIAIEALETNEWNNESVFENLDCVSEFFENGSIGFSPDKNGFEGLELKTYNWDVSLLKVKAVRSSFFENENIFPKDSVKFDNALLMKNIKHEWVKVGKIRS